MSNSEETITIARNPGEGSFKEWLTGKTATQLGFLIFLAVVWEVLYRSQITSPLLFPSFLDVLTQFWLRAGELFMRVGVTFSFIGYAMAISLVLSFLLTFFAMRSQAVASIV